MNLEFYKLSINYIYIYIYFLYFFSFLIYFLNLIYRGSEARETGVEVSYFGVRLKRNFNITSHRVPMDRATLSINDLSRIEKVIWDPIYSATMTTKM